MFAGLIILTKVLDVMKILFKLNCMYTLLGRLPLFMLCVISDRDM